MVISNLVVINRKTVMRDSIAATALQGDAMLTPEIMYTHLQCNYPKFYKMDKLCKWAVVATEYLLSGSAAYEGISKNKTGVVLCTNHGCLDVDKRYLDTIAVPSPALFVYTLPNIMLGEICIRHGFKGEQLCMVSEHFDAQELYFNTQDLLMNKGMEAGLCGWVDASGDEYDICLFWVLKKGMGIPFTAAAIQGIYDRYSAKSST